MFRRKNEFAKNPPPKQPPPFGTVLAPISPLNPNPPRGSDDGETIALLYVKRCVGDDATEYLIRHMRHSITWMGRHVDFSSGRVKNERQSTEQIRCNEIGY